MRDIDSVAAWRTSLTQRLEEELPESRFSTADRVRWLAEHLEEFVGRWVGFIGHPAMASAPEAGLLDSGFFVVIGLAVDLIDNELSADEMPDALLATWAEVKSTHARLQQGYSVALRDLLQRLTGEFLQMVERVARGS